MEKYNTVNFGQMNILNYAKNAVKRYEALAETLENNPMDFLTIQEIVLPDEFFSIMEQAGYKYSINGPMFKNNHGVSDCVGIVSKTPIKKIDFENPWERHLIAGEIESKGQLFNVFSAHLAWGPFNGFTRLEQVSIVDKISAIQEENKKGSVSLIGGDLNTDPDSRPIRFLKGHDLGVDNFTSTLWVDAYDIAGCEDNWTTADHAVNIYGKESAMKNGVIETSLIPRRRIDYIFSRGWCYGKTGCPVDFGYLEHPKGVVLSDHNGIYSKLAII